MNEIKFKIDGVEVKAKAGQTIMEAADEAGVYIPRLCWAKGLIPSGNCRVCTVMVQGRPQSACTFPASEGLVVEHDTPALWKLRKNLVEMLFVEGNHFCMFCEKSGNCELQAVGYKLGITTPKYPYQFPDRDVDASHKDIFIDRNRCIHCSRCIRASRDKDGKNIFQFVGRGPETRIEVNAEANLAGTDMKATDEAAKACPVGAILVKRVGFAVPVGKRIYDEKPVGSDIESKRTSGR